MGGAETGYQGGGVFCWGEVADAGGDVYEAGMGAEEGQEGEGGEEGAVVVCEEGLLDDVEVWEGC